MTPAGAEATVVALPERVAPSSDSADRLSSLSEPPVGTPVSRPSRPIVSESAIALIRSELSPVAANGFSPAPAETSPGGHARLSPRDCPAVPISNCRSLDLPESNGRNGMGSNGIRETSSANGNTYRSRIAARASSSATEVAPCVDAEPVA
ncbi:hypothetical protein [Nocardia sp. XZ_19_231]|uniref:hypothetical protein n=1 Tax=Nocardia sp. XZ_19_231 TaxID=2769252 RepID=UPI00188FDF0B|nr:hypothetical protein [Nocardia sp. XZ_19_231]